MYVLINKSCGVLTAMKTIYTDFKKVKQTQIRMNNKGYGEYIICKLEIIENEK